MLKKLNSLLTKRDKQFLFFMLFFSMLVSLLETLGVGIIMPFINVATNFNVIDSNKYLNELYQLLGFKNHLRFVVFFGVFLVFFYIVRSIINYVYFYMLARFSQGRYHLIAFRLFENYMGLPYYTFIQKNTSYMIKSIVNEANNLTQLIANILFMLSEVFVILFVYAFLLYVNWKMTILLTLFLSANVLIMKSTVSKKIRQAGDAREEFQKKFYELLNSSMGNFKIIKLKAIEKIIEKKFADASSGFATANIKNQSLTQVPRLFLEALGFSLIAIIVIYLIVKYQQDVRGVIPILMAFVLGLYRLMPSVNRIMSSYNAILFYSKSLDIVHNELIYESESLGNETIEFSKKIELKNVSFEYIENKPVLQNINFEIKKGEKIGFAGKSGSGKSTLIDIIIGLYRPKTGEVVVDGAKISERNIKSWRKRIGYIPQQIYLIDSTVAENVAFGEETIDENKVKESLKKANILDFLEKYHEGIYTRIGENAVNLSGGQKQRIAIARAIYNDPEILVLDEATSSLDIETEEKIMDEIYKIGQNKTLLIIAHRLSTLKNCDKVVYLEGGNIRS